MPGPNEEFADWSKPMPAVTRKTFSPSEQRLAEQGKFNPLVGAVPYEDPIEPSTSVADTTLTDEELWAAIDALP